jgi:hypothetical protein
MKAAFRGSAFAKARPPARRLRKSAGGGEGARPLPKVAPYGPRAPPTLGGVDLGFLRVLPAPPRPLPRHRTGGLGRLRARPHGSFPATFAHPLGRETHPVRLTLTTPPSRPRRLGSPRPAPPLPIREPGGRHSGLFARRGSQTHTRERRRFARSSPRRPAGMEPAPTPSRSRKTAPILRPRVRAGNRGSEPARRPRDPRGGRGPLFRPRVRVATVGFEGARWP